MLLDRRITTGVTAIDERNTAPKSLYKYKHMAGWKHDTKRIRWSGCEMMMSSIQTIQQDLLLL
jgi:hypothetical protein